MKAIEKKGYVQATQVQSGAIPYFIQWRDVIAKAPTGNGQDLCLRYSHGGVYRPGIHRFAGTDPGPTGSWAVQIQDELQDLFVPSRRGVRVACLYGGQPIEKQIQLKKRPQIVVATPAASWTI